MRVRTNGRAVVVAGLTVVVALAVIVAMFSAGVGAANTVTDATTMAVNEWSSTGNSFTANGTGGLTTGPNGDIYVLNESDDIVHQFEPSGSKVATHDVSSETTDTEDIAFDGNNFYVLDAFEDVYKYDTSWSYTGTSDSVSDSTNSALSLAAGEDGKFYVMDQGADTIYVHDSGFSYTGTSHTLSTPSALNDIHQGNNANWFVADSSSDKVYKYDSSWSYTGTSYSVSNALRIGQVDSGNWYNLDGTETVTEYTGTQGFPDISGTVTDSDGNAIEDVTVTLDDSDGTQVDSTTTDSNGDYEVTTDAENEDFTVEASKRGYRTNSTTVSIKTSDKTGVDLTLHPNDPPYVVSADPSNNEYLNQSDRMVDLNATIDDDDGDKINYTIYHDRLDGTGWEQVASGTDISAGTEISTTVQAGGGANRWKVSLNDSVNDINSSVFKYRVGGDVVVYNGSDYTKLTSETVTMNLTSTESGFNSDRSTTDATFNLTDVPAEKMNARVNATGFEEIKPTIDDPREPQVFVLYDTADAYEQCFSIDDQTGSFPPSETLLRAKHQFGGSYQQVDNDEFGAPNKANLSLKDGEDYSLSIESDDGDVRSIGSFVGDASKSGRCISLVVSDDGANDINQGDADEIIEGELADGQFAYKWLAVRKDARDNSGDQFIDFEWNLSNSSRTTDGYRLAIYEYQNKSNEIYNSSYGQVNSVTHNQTLVGDETNTTWIVVWNATIGGEAVNGSKVLGEGRSGLAPGVPLSGFWQEFFYVASMILVAGLFGGLRGEAGAVILPIWAAVFWWIGWIPSELGILTILAAMLVGAYFHTATEGEEV